MAMSDLDIDKSALYDDLVKAFISYQYRLENPMPPIPTSSPIESIKSEEMQYMSDPLFHRKVDQLACGVMHVIEGHIK